jgi:Fic family protein
MSAPNKKRKNRARTSRASGTKRRPTARSGSKRLATGGRSRPSGRASGAAVARAKAAREKAQKLARLKREKAEKLARLKREKAQKFARLKREKAEKLARLKREKALKAARLKRERDEALRAKKRKLEAEKQKRAKELEAARVRATREREVLAKKKEREREQKERERQREAALREKERAKEKALREAERAKEKRAAEQRRLAERQAREEERKRLAAEREAAKEAARKAKEEERARREAEREAYRKAKEAERERLRAEREAARRLREGKVARATKAAQRVDGLRVGTTRVYDPSSIPNQSGTTRRMGEVPVQQRLVGVRPATETPSSGVPAQASQPAAPTAARPTPPPPPTAATIEQRYRRILDRLGSASEALKKEYEETLEMSWIHHDSALEGVVYTFQELRAAMDPTPSAVADSSLQPVCEEIRRHRQAIAYVRDLGERRRVPLNVDSVKKLYVMLHPEEGDVKTVKYRKDIPQHRLYFHEYAPPDKIAYRVRQIMDWLNGPEAKKMKNPLRVAARVHYDLVRVFPFPNDSGKVARLLMNIVLLRGGYPPAIIHSTERQRYYEALKGQLPVIVQLVNESILNALSSIEKRLDDEERASQAS